MSEVIESAEAFYKARLVTVQEVQSRGGVSDEFLRSIYTDMHERRNSAETRLAEIKKEGILTENEYASFLADLDKTSIEYTAMIMQAAGRKIVITEKGADWLIGQYIKSLESSKEKSEK